VVDWTSTSLPAHSQLQSQLTNLYYSLFSPSIARPNQQLQKSASTVVVARVPLSPLADSSSDNEPQERGVSIDQDGKSNVWAIEPKMEVASKSSEETTQGALFAGAGLGLAAVVAAVVLTNLPDPSQF
jgi:hypothetical protein